jgi:hypothetical protein
VESIFDKFGGIRQMAAKVGVPPSTVKSWDTSLSIPAWRHDAILAAARKSGHVTVTLDDLLNVQPSSRPRTESVAA